MTPPCLVGPPRALTLFIAVAFVALTGGAKGLTLQVTPPTANVNTFDLELIVGTADPSFDTSTASGTVELDLDHTLESGGVTVTGIGFTGGVIDFSDLFFSVAFGLITVEGESIAGVLETTSAPSVVTGGVFDATDHQLNVNQGFFISKGVLGNVIDQRDNSEAPFGGGGIGDGTITLSESSRDATTVTYQTTLELPIAFVGRVQDVTNGDPLTVDLDMSGLIQATGLWTVPLSQPGDYNLDTVVDESDYLLWASLYGTAGPEADGNGDGVVGAADYTIWRDNFTASSLSSGPLSTAVPEPVGLLSWLAAWLPLVALRR